MPWYIPIPLSTIELPSQFQDPRHVPINQSPSKIKEGKAKAKVRESELNADQSIMRHHLILRSIYQYAHVYKATPLSTESEENRNHPLLTVLFPDFVMLSSVACLLIGVPPIDDAP